RRGGPRPDRQARRRAARPRRHHGQQAHHPVRHQLADGRVRNPHRHRRSPHPRPRRGGDGPDRRLDRRGAGRRGGGRRWRRGGRGRAGLPAGARRGAGALPPLPPARRPGVIAAAGWAPDSWQRRAVLQQPRYDDPQQLATVLRALALLPPLVTSWEVEALKRQIAAAAAGDAFLLQGGDCAESFDACSADEITSKLKILLQMSLVLVYGTRRRVIRVGRFAGQYAKPRSAEVEEVGGQLLPVYRGDLINGPGATPAERRADPERLLRAYERSGLTINFIRALVEGGFADLHHPEYWDLDWVDHSPLGAEYRRMVAAIGESLRFMAPLAGQPVSETSRVDFYTSHEGLHLHYEQAQTRRVPHRDGWYDLATHFPWIGLRTADPDGAHVEFFRGVANPVAVKIGPGTTPDRLRRLLDKLHPANEPGRLTLIHRFGAGQIADALPPLLEAVR